MDRKRIDLGPLSRLPTANICNYLLEYVTIHCLKPPLGQHQINPHSSKTKTLNIMKTHQKHWYSCKNIRTQQKPNKTCKTSKSIEILSLGQILHRCALERLRNSLSTDSAATSGNISNLHGWKLCSGEFHERMHSRQPVRALEGQ